MTWSSLWSYHSQGEFSQYWDQFVPWIVTAIAKWHTACCNGDVARKVQLLHHNSNLVDLCQLLLQNYACSVNEYWHVNTAVCGLLHSGCSVCATTLRMWLCYQQHMTFSHQNLMWDGFALASNGCWCICWLFIACHCLFVITVFMMCSNMTDWIICDTTVQ